MKQHITSAACALALGAAAALAPNAWSQETLSDRAATSAPDQQVSHVVRASQVIGTNVTNAHGDEMGEIKDLTVEPGSGKIRYAALSAGGTLGIGDKLVALPWNALTLTKSDGGDDLTIRVNVDQQQLKSARGFSDEQWPMQPEFGASDSAPASAPARQTDVDVQVNRETGVNVDVDRTPDAADTQTSAAASDRASGSTSKQQKLVRVSYLMDAKVMGPGKQEIGEVDDLAIDAKTGRIGYVAVQAGGILDVADSAVAVAWPSFQIRTTSDQDELQMAVDLNEQQLKNAPALSDDGNWPAPSRIPGFRDETPAAGLSSP